MQFVLNLAKFLLFPFLQKEQANILAMSFHLQEKQFDCFRFLFFVLAADPSATVRTAVFPGGSSLSGPVEGGSEHSPPNDNSSIRVNSSRNA